MNRPRRFFGGLVWVLVIVALGYGGFVAYERWWGTPELKEKIANVEEATGRILGAATEWVKETLRQSAKETAGDVIISASDSLASYGEDLKESAFVSNPIAPAPAPAPEIGTPAVGLSVAVNAPLSFYLASTHSYSADWGDGRKEEKTGLTGDGITVNHRWSSPGRYAVSIKIRNGEVTAKDTFVINVVSLTQ